MNERYIDWQKTGPANRDRRGRARRELLVGAGALSLGALLRVYGRQPRPSAAASPGADPAGWTPGEFAGQLNVSLAQAVRQRRLSRDATATGPGSGIAVREEFVEISGVLQLNGYLSLTLTVSEAGVPRVMGHIARATWSVQTVTTSADGRRGEVTRSGRLEGGELALDAGTPDGEPRLLWQGATWRGGAFPSYTSVTYGPDGRQIGPFGDGVTGILPADPLVLTVVWRTPDLIVASIDAESLRPPGPGGGSTPRPVDSGTGPLEIRPGDQVSELGQTAAGTAMLQRQRNSSAPPAR